MSEHQAKKKCSVKSRIFCENPYDLETIFESLSVASEQNKELLFIDQFVAYLRLDPQLEITEISYKILKDLNLITEEM